MPDLLQKAWKLAALHHEGQRYTTPEKDVTLPLHDSLEDTNLTEESIGRQFGDDVLAGVKALTKDETLPTKRAQMEDSLARILAQPREIAVVKLCDRINNLAPPPHHWSHDKRMAYRAEAELILDQLGSASPVAAARLRKKIVAYDV